MDFFGRNENKTNWKRKMIKLNAGFVDGK